MATGFRAAEVGGPFVRGTDGTIDRVTGAFFAASITTDPARQPIAGFGHRVEDAGNDFIGFVGPEMQANTTNVLRGACAPRLCACLPRAVDTGWLQTMTLADIFGTAITRRKAASMTSGLALPALALNGGPPAPLGSQRAATRLKGRRATLCQTAASSLRQLSPAADMRLFKRWAAMCHKPTNAVQQTGRYSISQRPRIVQATKEHQRVGAV
jgi:hypothetical protein